MGSPPLESILTLGHGYPPSHPLCIPSSGDVAILKTVLHECFWSFLTEWPTIHNLLHKLQQI